MNWKKRYPVTPAQLDALKRLLRRHARATIRGWPHLLDNKYVEAVLRCYLAEVPPELLWMNDDDDTMRPEVWGVFYRAYCLIGTLQKIRLGLFHGAKMRRALGDYERRSRQDDDVPVFVEMARRARIGKRGPASIEPHATRGLIIRTIAEHVPDTKRYNYMTTSPDLKIYEARIPNRYAVILGLARLARPGMRFTRQQVRRYLSQHQQNQ